MVTTIEKPASKKQHIIQRAADSLAGKEVCDPNAPCQPCKRTDLQLLVVLPSVIAKEHAPVLKNAAYTWASHFDAQFSAIKRQATVPVARIMREGYVYLYYVQRARWDVWQVMSNGLTRKIISQVDVDQYATSVFGFDTSTPPKLCSRGAANVPAHLIGIQGAASTDKLWLAFSDRLWTADTLQRYTENPTVDVPNANVKKPLRELRGREINPKSILAGNIPSEACLALNKTNLEQHIVDFVGQAKKEYHQLFATQAPALDAGRIGQAEAFEKQVREVERSISPSANPNLYLNKSLIIMLADAHGIANEHNNIRLKTISEHQGWLAGGPDVEGKNENKNRPWERQSLLNASYIREWIKDQKRDMHRAMLDQGVYKTSRVISATEYRMILKQEKETGELVNSPGTTYQRLSGSPERYLVTFPKKEIDEGIESLANNSAKSKIDRYNAHLDWGKIDIANQQWQKQEAAWLARLEARDTDYVTWLSTSAFEVATQYDFDNRPAVASTKRTHQQVKFDVNEAVERLQLMARCYGGGECSNISLKHMMVQLSKDEKDKSHHLAQAMLGEFSIVDKAKTDDGTRADLYDSVTSARDAWEQFSEAWQQKREQASAAANTLLLTTNQVANRMRELSLQPQLAKHRGLSIALEDAKKKQVVWARAEGFASFLETGQRQYAIGVKWNAGAFADALTEPTLAATAIDVQSRNVTGKQARKAKIQTRAELKPVIARNSATIDTTVMLVLDERKLAEVARVKGEPMLEVVSPGLFGMPQGVTHIPESMARHVVREYTMTGFDGLKTSAMWLNIGALLLQRNALMQSWEDLAKKGGLEQQDALFSLLGSVAGVAGATLEIGAIFLAPVEKGTLGTPAAAVLNKIPAYLWLRTAAGATLAVGSFFDAAVAYVRYLQKNANGDKDAASAYAGASILQFLGGTSLGLGAFYAHRARVLAYFGEQVLVRTLGSMFSPIALARCFTGVGLVLWLGGLGLTFYAMYLEDDDNELYLRRSYFGYGHPQLGKFETFEHELAAFGSLAIGTRAALEWHDQLGLDQLVATVKLYQPEPSAVVTLLLVGYNAIGGNKVSELYRGEMPAPKLSPDQSEAANHIYSTEHKLSIPDNINAVKLYYAVYKDRTPRAQPIARGELWIED